MADVITGVAIKSKTGAMISLPRPHRHHHIFALAAFLGIDLEDGHQGFTTVDGRFVSRKAAFKMVIVHDQPNRRSRNTASEELFSEDIW